MKQNTPSMQAQQSSSLTTKKATTCKYCKNLIVKVDDDGSILNLCLTCGAKYL